MRKINGVAPSDRFPAHHLRDVQAVEMQADTVRRDLIYRAAWDHPDPAYRADPDELESVQRSYTRQGYDAYGYPQGWTGPRTVDATWTPRTFWEEQATARRGRARREPATAASPQSPQTRTRGRSARRGRQVELPPELLEHLIAESWQDLARKNQDWVSFLALRPQLTRRVADTLGVECPQSWQHLPDKTFVDQTIIAMMKRAFTVDGFPDQHCVHPAPDSNRKALKAEDHEAAIRIGGELKHLLAFEDDYFIQSGYRRKGKRWVR